MSKGNRWISIAAAELAHLDGYQIGLLAALRSCVTIGKDGQPTTLEINPSHSQLRERWPAAGTAKKIRAGLRALESFGVLALVHAGGPGRNATYRLASLGRDGWVQTGPMKDSAYVPTGPKHGASLGSERDPYMGPNGTQAETAKDQTNTFIDSNSDDSSGRRYIEGDSLRSSPRDPATSSTHSLRSCVDSAAGKMPAAAPTTKTTQTHDRKNQREREEVREQNKGLGLNDSTQGQSVNVRKHESFSDSWDDDSEIKEVEKYGLTWYGAKIKEAIVWIAPAQRGLGKGPIVWTTRIEEHGTVTVRLGYYPGITGSTWERIQRRIIDDRTRLAGLTQHQAIGDLLALFVSLVNSKWEWRNRGNLEWTPENPEGFALTLLSDLADRDAIQTYGQWTAPHDPFCRRLAGEIFGVMEAHWGERVNEDSAQAIHDHLGEQAKRAKATQPEQTIIEEEVEEYLDLLNL